MKTYGPVDELFANLTATQFSYEELMALVKEWVNGKQHYVFATDCVQGVTILAAQMCDLAWQGRAQCVSFGNVNKTTKFTGLIHLWAVPQENPDSHPQDSRRTPLSRMSGRTAPWWRKCPTRRTGSLAKRSKCGTRSLRCCSTRTC
jgi:hypothetical protein